VSFFQDEVVNDCSSGDVDLSNVMSPIHSPVYEDEALT
jgi:hypothetical protein